MNEKVLKNSTHLCPNKFERKTSNLGMQKRFEASEDKKQGMAL